jgi:hypothetical protein
MWDLSLLQEYRHKKQQCDTVCAEARRYTTDSYDVDNLLLLPSVLSTSHADERSGRRGYYSYTSYLAIPSTVNDFVPVYYYCLLSFIFYCS